MSTVTRDITDALPRAAAAFADVARAAARPEAIVRATPEWSVADVAAHVAIECDRYRREVDGESDWADDPRDIARVNRDALAADPDRDIEASSARIAASVARYVERLRMRDLDEPSHRLDGGLVMAPRHAAGVLLGELVVHRHDIARATGQRADITRDDAVLVIDGVLNTLPGMLDREAAGDHVGTYEIRVRGAGAYTVQIDHGTVAVSRERRRRPDAVMSVDPVGFVLTSYGRQGPVRTALKLQAFVWGRRPHRAFALDRLFHRI